jgi:SAM-dependent methyltransferase
MRGRRNAPAPLLGGRSYFEYQRLLGRDVVIPWLAARLELERLQVGDFGAHHGGMLDALREGGVVDGAIGLELSRDVVASSPFVPDDRFRLEVADVMAVDGPHEFDLVLMHDVLEHIPEYDRALDAVSRALVRDGHLFVSFPPYYSAFGGHQQLARGLARMAPFAHLLPAKLFFHLAKPGEQEYMTVEGAYQDMLSVRRTRLTLTDAERAFSSAGFEVLERELFIVRPEYTIRYGLKPRAAGVLGRLRGVRELIVNGAFYLLRQGDRSAVR